MESFMEAAKAQNLAVESQGKKYEDTIEVNIKSGAGI
jgi:hypothetical protein